MSDANKTIVHDRPVIMISSTARDLPEHRRELMAACLSLDMVPKMMEHLPAVDADAIEASLDLVNQADVYLGVFAYRYGYVPEGREISITEMEYRRAIERKVPRLIFLIHKDHLVTGDDFETGPGAGKLEALKSELGSQQVVGFFSSATDLRAKVSESLAMLRDRLRAQSSAGKEPDAATEPAGERPPPSIENNPYKSLSAFREENSPPTEEESSPELVRYREAAEALHTNIELAGFKTRLRVPIDLQELYVPLHANVDLRAVGDARFADAAEAESALHEHGAGRDLSLLAAFNETIQRKRRGLLILGDPGSGKTTHLKRLLLWCLREGPQSLGLPVDILPVFLPLRELRDLSKGLEVFIENQLDSPHLQMSAGFGARLLQRGKLLLLFDGLDEVTDSEHRAEVAEWIENATIARHNCVPVVTCRFAGYGGEVRLSENFLELHVRPLTPGQSDTFIRNWYRIVETGLAEIPEQGAVQAEQRADDLIERLRQPDFRAARLVEMTRNPLLLANLCLVHCGRGVLPKGRAQLYAECVDVLLERWRESKGVAIMPRAA